jgi:methionine aminotransferase
MFTPHSKLPQVGTTIFTVVTQRARQLGAINLSQGFPDYEPPELLKSLLVQAAGADTHQYAPMGGIYALRQQIAIAAAELGITVTQDEITVTLGATEALFSSIQALVHAGDEVIVFDPSYDSYGPAISLCAARAIHIPMTVPGFGIDWQRVRDAITPRTRMIIINSPHNPSGAVLRRADLNALAELVRDTPIVVLSDEVYANMIYEGELHVSVQAHPELRERSIAVFSFGKVLHATGWRVGYALAPAALTRELRRVHQFNTFSIAHPLQWAIARFLEAAPDHRAGLSAFYRAKRDYFLKHLEGSRFAWQPSPGTYFQLLDYSAISAESDVQFAERVLNQHGVAAIPLSPFCVQQPDYRYLRFCFAKRDATLHAAAERLCKI